MPWRRNPWVYGVRGFHPDLRVLIPASSLLLAPWVGFHPHFTARGTLPYPCVKDTRPSFGGPLNPDHSRRTHAGLVSYYALFKGWLLLSQPPSCHSTRTSFAILSGHFGTLAVALGSFPLAVGHYRSTTASRGPFHRYSEFGWGWYRVPQPAPIQSLYLLGTILEALPQ